LATAGARPVQTLPQTPERMGSDPTDYVVVPLDTALQFAYRAQQFTKDLLQAGVQPARVFQILVKLERGDRSVIVEKFRGQQGKELG
jgi:hypothetical protein